MHTTYTGELVRIRPFRDLDEWMRFQSQRELHMNAHWGPWHTPESAQRRSFEEDGLLGGEEGSHAIERLDTGEVAGVAHHGSPQGGELAGWLSTFIARPHWSRGFGREAKLLKLCHLFENYPIQSVWAGTTAEHGRASAGLVACGFRPAGTLRAWHWHGQRVDIVDYQVMREDWAALPIRGIVKRGAGS